MRWLAFVVLVGCSDAEQGKTCDLAPQDIDVERAPLFDHDVTLTVDDWLGFQRSAAGRMCGVVAGRLTCVRDGATTDLGSVDHAQLPLVKMVGDEVHVVTSAADTWQWLREGESPQPVERCRQIIGFWIGDDGEPRVLCGDGFVEVFLWREAGAWLPRQVAWFHSTYPVTASVPASAGGGYAFTAERDAAELTETNPRLSFVVVHRDDSSEDIELMRNDALSPLDLVFDHAGGFALLAHLVKADELPQIVVVRGRIGGGAVRVLTVDGQALPGARFVSGRVMIDDAGLVHAAWFEHTLELPTLRRAVGYAIVHPDDRAERLVYSDDSGSLLGGRLGANSKLSVVSVDLEGGRAVARGVLIDTEGGQPELATIRFPACGSR